MLPYDGCERHNHATEKLQIFLADDHLVVREGLKALINAQPDMIVIGEAGDARPPGSRRAIVSRMS
jgi:hypothetical protein